MACTNRCCALRLLRNNWTTRPRYEVLTSASSGSSPCHVAQHPLVRVFDAPIVPCIMANHAVHARMYAEIFHAQVRQVHTRKLVCRELLQRALAAACDDTCQPCRRIPLSCSLNAAFFVAIKT